MSRRALVFLFLLAAAMPCAVRASAEALPSAREVVASIESRFASMNDYVCLADAHYVKGAEREDKLFRIYFKKPELVRMEVLRGNQEGGAVVLTKDGRVKAHAGGWLSWLVLSFPLDSPLVTTIRGHTLRQSHFGYMINMMKGIVATNEANVRAEDFGGVSSYVLETSLSGPDGVPQRKVAIVDRRTSLLEKVEEFEGATEVVNVTFYDVKVDQGLSDDLFDM